MKFFSIFPVFSYIATIQGVSVRAQCTDSPLRAIFDGLEVEGATCAEISGAGLDFYKLSRVCLDQNLDQHCPVLCRSCISDCVDSGAVFEVDDGERITCADVVADISKCSISGVTETCQEACTFCPEPVNTTALALLVNELSEKINVLEDSQSEISAKNMVLEDSQSRICENIGQMYIKDYGCFPVTTRGENEMIYIKNSAEEGWEYHEEMAVQCGGHLASILDENEQDKVTQLAELSISYWLGIKQEEPCNDEPKGCWNTWTDGNPVVYTNWLDGQPYDPPGNQDCMQTNNLGNTYEWWDNICDRLWPGIYILPPTFDSSPNCTITIAQMHHINPRE